MSIATDNFRLRVKTHLQIKVGEQLTLSEQEARMSEKLAGMTNPQWRLKLQVNRQRVSRRLAVVNNEISGLSAILRGETEQVKI